MGLGLLGRGINVAKFLSEEGAKLLITDLKSKEELASSLTELEGYSNIEYVLGEHRLEDFKDKDLIIRAANVPLDSIYIEEARKNNIPIEMDASLFVKLVKGVTIVGITGTRGKSTVTELIYKILEASGKRVFLAGNIRGRATLPLLNEVREGDIVVMELDSWQLQGFGDSKISPHISVFTNFMPDHMNYYKGDMDRYFSDKANIFNYQKEGDVFFRGNGVHTNKGIVVENIVPTDWSLKLKGKHNLQNISFAISVVRELKVEEDVIKNTVESFGGVPGRLELVKEENGILYYNDTTATTPDALLAALNSLEGNIILIAGGADKELSYGKVAPLLNSVKKLILFEGTATDKIVTLISTDFTIVENMKDAVKVAKENAEAGDTILLSPGAASFGIFKNEFDRGDQFIYEIYPKDIANNIHMVGIGGIGMSALAQLLLHEGKKVTGSDRGEFPTTELLQKKGIDVFIGDAEVPADAEVLIYSSAYPEDNPERAEAKKRGIPELSYFEALGEVSKEYFTITVSGTHGKTTTTGMLGKILIDAGLSPTIVVGSILKDFDSNFVAGKNILVVEGCEYMDHLLELQTDMLVITNIEFDHPDHFENLAHVQQTFKKAIDQFDGKVVVNLKDKNSVLVVEGIKKERVVDYSQEEIGDLLLIGDFNKMNAQAAKSAAFQYEPSLKGIDESLGSFKGAWRRFEHLGEANSGALVYSDYAHHPTAIRVTLDAVREKFPDTKIAVVFYPHLHSRTKMFFDEFAKELGKADYLIVAPIYKARKEDTEGVSSERLVEKIKEKNKNAYYFKNIDDIVEDIEKNTSEGDIIITMGAGDNYKVGEKLV